MRKKEDNWHAACCWRDPEKMHTLYTTEKAKVNSIKQIIYSKYERKLSKIKQQQKVQIKSVDD